MMASRIRAQRYNDNRVHVSCFHLICMKSFQLMGTVASPHVPQLPLAIQTRRYEFNGIMEKSNGFVWDRSGTVIQLSVA